MGDETSDESGGGVVRDAEGRFAPGTTGRPFGSRNRVSARVASAILADFEANQAELLPRLRRWFLPQYLQLVGRLLPKRGETGAGGLAEAAALLEALDASEIERLLVEARAADDQSGLVRQDAATKSGQPGAGTDIIGGYR